MDRRAFLRGIGVTGAAVAVGAVADERPKLEPSAKPAATPAPFDMPSSVMTVWEDGVPRRALELREGEVRVIVNKSKKLQRLNIPGKVQVYDGRGGASRVWPGLLSGGVVSAIRSGGVTHLWGIGLS